MVASSCASGSANFGLAYVSVYLLSGAVGTLAALGLNRALVRD